MLTDTETKEKLTTGQIFKQYFKIKAIVFLLMFVVAAIGSWFNHGFEWRSLLELFSLMVLATFILGYMDYHFYEKSAKKIILKLLNESPLNEFQGRGFVYEDDVVDKISGEINDFKIILSPVVNASGGRFLTILIPIKIKEGLEKYFIKFDELFKLKLSGEVLFAEAVIKDYNKNFDFDKLFKAIQETTERLKAQSIHPIEIIED
jgi:hypothetical protein